MPKTRITRFKSLQNSDGNNYTQAIRRQILFIKNEPTCYPQDKARRLGFYLYFYFYEFIFLKFIILTTITANAKRAIAHTQVIRAQRRLPRLAVRPAIT